MTSRNDIELRFKALQQKICNALEKMDGKSAFHSDSWDREAGGGGLTKVLSDGHVIEKGGVNFSAVHGEAPKKITDALGLKASQFYATGVSIVLHPHNPWMPIIHMNIRYFEMDPVENQGDKIYWFGGGIDLTPHYIDISDGGFFHQSLKKVCDKTDSAYYMRFKKWADDYFFIKHRNETRGIGGIFFDRINEKNEEHSFDDLWSFVINVGEQFIPIYQHFVEKYSEKPFDESHKTWQLLRRGRYVEFNLVWDKGTKFGLDTDGRTESILMSLPKNASWAYDHQPAVGSLEEQTLKLLKKNIDWISHA